MTAKPKRIQREDPLFMQTVVKLGRREEVIDQLRLLRKMDDDNAIVLLNLLPPLRNAMMMLHTMDVEEGTIPPGPYLQDDEETCDSCKE